MRKSQKISKKLYSPIIGEGKIRTLYPDGELIMPINQLIVPREFRSAMNDIMKFCSLIEDKIDLPPILVSDKNLIIDGNKRYYAYLRLGYQKIAVIRQQNIGDGFGDNEFSILNIHS